MCIHRLLDTPPVLACSLRLRLLLCWVWFLHLKSNLLAASVFNLPSTRSPCSNFILLSSTLEHHLLIDHHQLDQCMHPTSSILHANSAHLEHLQWNTLGIGQD
ncbi:hypothetical protein P280DRAFT_323097 [Massarina eburnea CBS 473.64]|uniref:Uncharacterized protein n=1 Tax=Massarina eburnea CBS 473.64 TaxID=1395130 RepID=A0A6A6RZ82_9PLEO|nr:hypothetical protein P280DRAFT_323097 [Massarina eburnea CBS 473.64]